VIFFKKTLCACGTPDFAEALKGELSALKVGELPLQKGMRLGSCVLDAPISVVSIRSGETEEKITVRAGIFFKSAIAGCSCADDPTPVDELEEHCEILIEIEKATAQASFQIAE
jgi:hypothetical protein